MTFESEQVETLRIWDRDCQVKIVADIFPGEEITQDQQSAYESFFERQEDIFQQAYQCLKQFCEENYPDKINWESFNIFSYIIPKSIYIAREKGDKRVVGLFCKFRFDRENDLVVRIENEIVTEVGTQDIIL